MLETYLSRVLLGRETPVEVLGPDVSHFQSNIDWKAVAAHGEAFGACKATEGMAGVDKRFARNWSGIRKAGIEIRIAYHYGHTESSADAQAAHFLATVGDLRTGDLLCLDIEDVCAESKAIPPKRTAAWVASFLDRVVETSGLGRDRVLLYTGQWWWDPRTGRSKVAAEHPLWVADYTNDPPKLPAGWSDWLLHQYTSKDTLPGVASRVDRNRLKGPVDRLRRLAGLAAGPAPAPVPVPAPTVTLPVLDNLAFGARNDDVRALQARLAERGFPVVVDGFYGPQTRAAVSAFQSSHPDLDGAPDGLVGPLTLELLFA